MISHSLFRVVAIALLLPFISHLSPAEEASPQSKELIGTWILAGTPDNVQEPPAAGGRLKFITARHWTITQANPQNGEVIFHHGGTYTLKGNEYVETVQYANRNTVNLVGKVHTFTLKVDGDTLTVLGVGNPWTEIWKRVK